MVGAPRPDREDFLVRQLQAGNGIAIERHAQARRGWHLDVATFNDQRLDDQVVLPDVHARDGWPLGVRGDGTRLDSPRGGQAGAYQLKPEWLVCGG